MRLALFLLPLLLLACSKAPEPLPGTEKDYPLVTIQGFSIEAKVINVQQEDVFLFDYPTEAATEAELAKFSDNGRWIDGKGLPWPTETQVHIFATGRQIAVYLGSTKGVIEALLSEGGQQVVGDPLPAGVKMPVSSAVASSEGSSSSEG